MSNIITDYNPNKAPTGNLLLDFNQPAPTGNLLLDSPAPSILPVSIGTVADPETLLLNAISAQESRGEYGAVGQISISGQGRALGRYQMMPKTLIGLGFGQYLKSQNPDDYQDQIKATDLASPFLSTPGLQDQAARAYIRDLAQRLGVDLKSLTQADVAKIAAGWVGGPGMAKSPERWARATVGPGAKTTVAEYISRIVEAAEQQARLAPGGPLYPQVGPQVPPIGGYLRLGDTPTAHPLDQALLDHMDRIINSPVIRGVTGAYKTGRGVYSGLSALYEHYTPEEVQKALGAPRAVAAYGYGKFVGPATGLIFKGWDSLLAMGLGIPAGVLETFFEPKDAISYPTAHIRSYEDLARARANIGQGGGFQRKPGALWGQMKQLFPNIGRVWEDDLWDQYYGSGLGSLRTGARIAEFILPPELKGSSAAKWATAFSLTILDPLNWVTPAKLTQVAGRTSTIQKVVRTIEEGMYGNPWMRDVVIPRVFKRYADVAGGMQYSLNFPVNPEDARWAANFLYSAEHSSAIRAYEKPLREIIDAFGSNAPAQRSVHDYINATNRGARNAVLAKAAGQGFDTEKIASIGDGMIQAATEMGRYHVAKGFISEEEFKALNGHYLRIVYERYLDPQKFADDLRRMNLPESWMPKVYETKLRSRLAKPTQYKRPLLSDSSINKLMYRVMENPNRTLDEWLTLVNDFVAKDKNWAKAHYRMKQHAVENILDLLTEPQPIGKTVAGKKGFLLLPEKSAGEIISPTGQKMQPWQIKSTAERRVASSAELASKIEGEMGDYLSNRPFLRIHGLQRKLRLFTQRKDLPPEIKELLGEVLEAGPAYAQELTIYAKQRAIAELQEYLAKNVARTTAQLNATNPKLIESGRWKPIVGRPDVLGPLFRDVTKGEDLLYVPTPFHRLADDLGSSLHWVKEGRERAHSKFMDTIETFTSGWKRLLVTHRLGGVLRNMFGTVIMGDLGSGGLIASDPGVIYRGIKELHERGPFFQRFARFADPGIDTLSNRELRLTASLLKDATPKDYIGKLQKGAQHLWDDPVKFYGFTDASVRMAVAMKLDEAARSKLGRALTDSEFKRIVMEAMDTTINYGDVPYFVEKVRKFGVFPVTSFISFPFKFIPRFFKAMWEHPTTVLKYPRALEAWNNALLGEEGYETLAGISPEFLRHNMIVAVPWTDGSRRFFNVGWILPWQSLDEVARNIKTFQDPTGAREASFITTPFLNWWGELYYNRDWLGRPVVDPNLKGRDAIMAIAKYTVERLGGIGDAAQFADQIIEAERRAPDVKTDRYGMPLPTTGELILTAMGFRAYRIEPEAMKRRTLSTIRAELVTLRDAGRREQLRLTNRYGHPNQWTPDVQEEWAAYLENLRKNVAKLQMEAMYIQNLPLDSLEEQK